MTTAVEAVTEMVVEYEAKLAPLRARVQVLERRLEKIKQQAVITTSQGGACRLCERTWITEQPEHLHWCALRVVENREET